MYDLTIDISTFMKKKLQKNIIDLIRIINKDRK